MQDAQSNLTTIEPTDLTPRIKQGTEVLYSQESNLNGVNQRPTICPRGEANGTIMATLGIDGMVGSTKIRVESPRGQTDIETIERTMGLWTEVRNSLRKTAVA